MSYNYEVSTGESLQATYQPDDSVWGVMYKGMPKQLNGARQMACRQSDGRIVPMKAGNAA